MKILNFIGYLLVFLGSGIGSYILFSNLLLNNSIIDFKLYFAPIIFIIFLILLFAEVKKIKSMKKLLKLLSIIIILIGITFTSYALFYVISNKFPLLNIIFSLLYLILFLTGLIIELFISTTEY